MSRHPLGPEKGAGDPGKRCLADPTRRPDRAHAPTDTCYNDMKYIQHKLDTARRETALTADRAPCGAPADTRTGAERRTR